MARAPAHKKNAPTRRNINHHNYKAVQTREISEVLDLQQCQFLLTAEEELKQWWF